MQTEKQGTSFPPSIQSDLFSCLKPTQQDFVKPILRVLKKPAQEELCCALLDYLETSIPMPPSTPVLEAAFRYLIHEGQPKGDEPDEKPFLYPLRLSGNSLQSKFQSNLKK